ncbi:DUF4846 domain-containing protein [Fusibacter sp. 3D3]|uniref:DUF4846 domain-containing protein n=1 Tax=Fusibacter sp. 3D3 TaxID=1048380 RepID=UPI001112DAB3|nr:DUF4846 domain-containing protein [Fusibacter sp. 3D3]
MQRVIHWRVESIHQCADSPYVMRIYAEYYYANKQYDQIKFHFVNEVLCETNF